MFTKIKNRIKRYSNPREIFWRLRAIGREVLLHKYQKPDGSFDYELYRKVQIAGNHAKLNLVNVQEADISFLVRYLKKQNPNIKKGICHGTRRGLEQKWFGEQLEAEIIGTEISDTAKNFPNTIQWDFHDDNPDWHGAFDFVYTNSLDHAYDPGKALSAWMRTLTPTGLAIVEHSLQHVPSGTSELDPFGAKLDVMPYLVLQWSQGTYSVRHIITSDFVQAELGQPRTYLVIKNN